jgi:DDE_Tnp_1-associated
LLDHLARVPDPRQWRGVRHSLFSVLAAAIAAVMAGAQWFTAIGEWSADAPPSVLASLGIRRDPRHYWNIRRRRSAPRQKCTHADERATYDSTALAYSACRI